MARFDESKSEGDHNDEVFTPNEIEQVLNEDSEQYDITLIIKSKILEEELKKEPGQKKVISKIM